ncbi:MAG: DMT family transporter [Planctomycetota bacterium]
MQILLLLLGVFACSTSVIFIKKSGVDPILLSGLRLAVAVVLLSPAFLRDWWRHRAELNWRLVRDSAIPGAVLALHFITWIAGARLTPAANSTLIVNIVPVVMPPLLWLLTRERITKREALATVVATIGLAVLFVSDFQLNEQHFRGDAVCFGSMLLLAVYLALAKKFRHHPTIWLYLVPLYASASLLCLIAAAPRTDLQSIDWAYEWPWVLALGLVPTVIGHSLLNNAMRKLRGQLVSIAVMGQFVVAGLLAYPFLGELPDLSFYPASLAIVVAGVIAAQSSRG